MQELLHSIAVTVRGIWNRRWIGLAVAWLLALLSMVLVPRIPERYEATARLYVNTKSLLRPVMAGLSILPNLEQQTALVSQTLITRPNVEKLLQTTRFDEVPESGPERELLVDRLMKTLQLTGDARSNSYVITYRDTDPRRAREVVQSLLTIFVQSSLGDKRDDTKSALAFLDEQIRRYEDNLQEAEDKLKHFKLKYLGVIGQGNQSSPDYFGRMSRLNEDIGKTKLELRAAIQSRDSYRRALSGESATVIVDHGSVAAPVAPAEIDQRIAAQRAKLDELLRIYTDQHPEVRGVRRVLAGLEAQRAAEIRERERNSAAGKSSPASSTLEQNPVYQRMRVSLADSEAAVAALTAKLASYEEEYARLRASARQLPEVEAEYTQLTRDYDVLKRTYGDLLARKQAASMGAEVQEQEEAMFRIVDPPRVSSQPVRPSRKMLFAISFLGALFGGAFASFAANAARPTFHEPRVLRNKIGRPFLGTLAFRPGPAARRQMRWDFALFLTGCCALVILFAGVAVTSLLSAAA